MTLPLSKREADPCAMISLVIQSLIVGRVALKRARDLSAIHPHNRARDERGLIAG